VGAGPAAAASSRLLLQLDRVWRHRFDKQHVLDATSGMRPTVRLVRPAAARDAYFVKDGSVWRRSQYTRSDAFKELAGSAVRWEHRDEDDTHEY
jgi:hypothetical protein